MNAFEVNFDGIVGPTHNYSGLSYGNIASQSSQYAPSNPRLAALQGLKKMKFLSDLGIKQAVLPPHERPHIPTLRKLGFYGSDAEVLSSAFQEIPEVLFAASSASAMWTANAATVCPSADSLDSRAHFTPANLSSKFHRSIESEITSKVLKAIFNDSTHFVHHDPLPLNAIFSDEGAANHSRFCRNYGETGIQLFVFGRYGLKAPKHHPSIYPARQTQEASAAIARLHQIPRERMVFAQQHPEAIDNGVFHNDVIAVANANLFLFHEQAFLNQSQVLEEIAKRVDENCKAEMMFLQISKEEIPLKVAVDTYLFNSQIVNLAKGGMALIAPSECHENESVKACLEKILNSSKNPIQEIHYIDLKQSMLNGGGPACLRLRVVLNSRELAAMSPYVLLDESLYDKLVAWVKKHYRDRLHPRDLVDPKLLDEARSALDDLTTLLHLGNIYDFQSPSF